MFVTHPCVMNARKTPIGFEFIQILINEKIFGL